ncbi:spermatogenesis-associated protein 9 isoform X5 [Oryctolagus cuniculus]|uniref:spermatogenesis-associated protein 9 isoform X5 n=1 Tax=Oryctolagus cuniculus TaxID=9986 RepID=UPI00222F121C|nr:spermatogenesis-associated protein 9 isoform X5 [Oryctolagus cuniculus]
MPIKPVGWICGQVLKNFSGRMEGIQKVIMDLADEFKDDFPTILRMSQSNQKRKPVQKTSRIRMAVVLAKINRGTWIRGLSSISRSSKSMAKLLQPQLTCRLVELRGIARRLLREVNLPRQPLYNPQTDTPAPGHRASPEASCAPKGMLACSSLMVNGSKSTICLPEMLILMAVCLIEVVNNVVKNDDMNLNKDCFSNLTRIAAPPSEHSW